MLTVIEIKKRLEEVFDKKQADVLIEDSIISKIIKEKRAIFVTDIDKDARFLGRRHGK